VAGDDRERWFTCPRCLAPLVNPNALVTTAAPSPRREVQEAPLRWLRERPPSLDDEVRRDTKGLGIGLISLALVGGIGIIIFFIVLCGGGLGNMRMAQIQQASTAALIIGVLLFIPAITGIVVAARSKDSGSRVMGGLLGAVGVGLLVLALCISFVVFAISSCLASCDKQPGSTPTRR
jgi:hypothetical protein